MKISVCTVLLAALTALSLTSCKNRNVEKTDDGALTDSLCPVAFNADSAYASIEKQCAFGPRVPGTKAHAECAEYIKASFEAYGLTVAEQQAEVTRWDGEKIQARNIIARYNPDAEERVVIATHWDSRPWADQDADPSLRHTPVPAANDGASGVAVAIELARHLKDVNPRIGVDFVCFDAEDCGAPEWGEADPDGNDWCLGSRVWAEKVRAEGYRARYGILLDMVGGKDARFCYEGFSKQYAEDILQRVWATAQTVGAGNLFVPQDGSYATDDHLNMNQIAGIRTIDIIPYVAGDEVSFSATWHTTHDTPANISRDVLRLVGQTLIQVLSEEM